MTSRTAQRVVLVCLLGLVLVRAVQNARRVDRSIVSPREIFGALAVGMALSLVAEPAPKVAAGLAGAALVTGTIAAGPQLFTNKPDPTLRPGSKAWAAAQRAAGLPYDAAAAEAARNGVAAPSSPSAGIPADNPTGVARANPGRSDTLPPKFPN